MKNNIWEDTKAICKKEMPSALFHLWIESLELYDMTETKATVKVKSNFALDLVQKQFGDQIQTALSQAAGHSMQLVYVVSPFPQAFGITDWDPAQCSSLEQYSFDEFPVTPGNKFAYTLLKEVGDFPGANINP